MNDGLITFALRMLMEVYNHDQMIAGYFPSGPNDTPPETVRDQNLQELSHLTGVSLDDLRERITHL